MPRSSIKFTGDWGMAAHVLGSLAVEFPAAVNRALAQEGQFYRRKIVEGLTSQEPGGKAFKPLSPLTIAIRRAAGFNGTKALIRTGDLRASVTATPVRDGAVFIGVLYTARSGDGRQLADIAKINEFGALIRTTMTRARLRFLRGVLRGAGLAATRSSGGMEQGAVLSIRIPPRPFLQPVFDAYSGMRGAMRFQARVSRNLGGMLGVLNHPDLGGSSPVAVAGKLGGRGAAQMSKGLIKASAGGKYSYTKSIRNAFKVRTRKPSVKAVTRKPTGSRLKRGRVKFSELSRQRRLSASPKKTRKTSVAKSRKPRQIKLKFSDATRSKGAQLGLRFPKRIRIPKATAAPATARKRGRPLAQRTRPKVARQKIEKPKVKSPVQLALRFTERKPRGANAPKQIGLPFEKGLKIRKVRKPRQHALALPKMPRVKPPKAPKMFGPKVPQSMKPPKMRKPRQLELKEKRPRKSRKKDSGSGGGQSSFGF